MLYRKDRYGNEISQLGYGCMRFTSKGHSIDFEKAEKEIMLAVKNGVNYFDTAYIYPGSEECLGRILSQNNIREKVNIATKLPQYMIKTPSQIEKTFNEELKRLKTDYIDYYLMHMFTDISEWEKMKTLGIEEWIKNKKEAGIIRNIGFSFHGTTEMFLKILNVYDWDFCQIQYNYLDEHTQAGRKGLEAAEKKGIPVIIMEPLRGGKLVNLPDKAKKLLNTESSFTPAELSFRWLWDQSGVTCVLSGMNSEEMVNENCRIASEAEPKNFEQKDHELVERIIKIIKEREKVGCTGCRYCMPCPKGVDIPGNFYFYNLLYMENRKKSALLEYGRVMGLRKEPGFATQCIGCGKCEQHCPQKIQIREKLKEADKELRPFPVKLILAAARKIMISN